MYQLTIDCATEEIAQIIKEYVNNHFHDDEVLGYSHSNKH